MTCVRRSRFPLQWRHNGRESVSNHQSNDCLLNPLFRRRSKKTSKLCVTGLCAGNSPGAGEFRAQMASTAENVSIWWRHHAKFLSHLAIANEQCVFPGNYKFLVFLRIVVYFMKHYDETPVSIIHQQTISVTDSRSDHFRYFYAPASRPIV